ncbi:hypothetical protein P5E62_14340 [Clostridium perfringens]|uniref:hypothetical protein n=1 Tax=Clostridium perfringens TaxID=1502 RepID=UPI001FB0E460|nr:hypothetical protein [Clostridium perfringens]MDK0710433.1 hypothetical protein [Clostridium perfringens]MDK0713318.1 hypothetical protein [Clostridium perfringens]
MNFGDVYKILKRKNRLCYKLCFLKDCRRICREYLEYYSNTYVVDLAKCHVKVMKRLNDVSRFGIYNLGIG